MTTTNLEALLRPINSPEQDEATVTHGGKLPSISIEVQGEGIDDETKPISVVLKATGFTQEYLAYFLHELSHMVAEPDDQTEMGVDASAN